MFGKQSRYRRQPAVAAPDGRGRVVTAPDLRLPPVVPGSFEHVVVAGDRLDQLAYSYYQQPQEYWRICDANPGFLSPLALLGQEALVTSRFPLASVPTDANWADLVAALRAVIGVDEVRLADGVTLVKERLRDEDGELVVANGRPVVVTRELHDQAVVVTYNRVLLTTDQIEAIIREHGFKAGPPVEAGQLGRPIIVPAAVDG